MSLAADDLRNQALALPVEDRAALALDLLASLDEEDVDAAEVKRLWSDETERRMAMLESGEVDLVSREDVWSGLAARRAERSA